MKQITTVDCAFENRIKDFSERRHTLIHRWFTQNGWPENAQQKLEITQFALALMQDAHDLTVLLATYLVEWMKRFPEKSELAKRQEEEWTKKLQGAKLALKIEQA